MAITDVKRKVSDSESRLCLLYVLEKLGLHTAQEIWPLIARLELMDYFSFGQKLAELSQSGELGSLPMGTLYVSAQGRKTLELFQNRIPASQRKEIDAEAKLYLLNLTNHLQASIRYESIPIPGCYAINASFRETEFPTLLLRLESSRGELCDAFFHRFRERLPRLISMLQEWLPSGMAMEEPKQDEDAFLHAECGSPLLHFYAPGEVSAAVKLALPDTMWRMQLLFPDSETASRWAVATDASGSLAAEKLCGLFL